MATMRDLLNDLETISAKPAAMGKKQLNEDARQETVNYIKKMKEAFGDMENEHNSAENLNPNYEMPAEEETPAEDSEVPKEEKTLEERVAELEAKVAELESKLEEKI